ncbi:SDR family NAD(P)-dependent oxidoreductase [Actinokineospora sp. G85]|uniref:SDR family NAD(P)-dependent oxidoreductase n=1 Tax=Actinokineospora sp. G85 TaxID=3406626 RepID=UPI003C762C14
MSAKKVVLVTGSSAGIGAATAARFAAGGYQVVVNSARSEQAGKEFAAGLPDAVYVRGDVSADAEAIVEGAVAAYGRLDVLVNNAGTTRIIPHTDVDAVTPEVWREILDVNVIGTWEMTRFALPHLRATGAGAIVNISSIAGSRPAGSSIPYAVSKASIEHMTRLLAASVGPQVRVNAVAPGLIETEWTKDFVEPRKWMEANAPLRRVGVPEDVARAVVDLAEAAYSTGTVLLVDGGTHLR